MKNSKVKVKVVKGNIQQALKKKNTRMNYKIYIKCYNSVIPFK